MIWLTFSPCYAEFPAERQQSQGEQPPGQRHLVIQLWRAGGPLGWVQVWARSGLLTVLESCVPPLLEAGLDPCHQLLGILLSLGSCLLQACGRKRQPMGLGPRGRADPGMALLPGCSPLLPQPGPWDHPCLSAQCLGCDHEGNALTGLGRCGFPLGHTALVMRKSKREAWYLISPQPGTNLGGLHWVLGCDPPMGVSTCTYPQHTTHTHEPGALPTLFHLPHSSHTAP